MADTTAVNRTQRLSETGKARLALIRQRPDPPRGPAFTGGQVTWAAPKEQSNITDYNIYTNTENNLARRVPLGQTAISGVTGDRVFISSYNANSGLESIKVLLNQTIGNLDKAAPSPPLFVVANAPGYLELSLPSFQSTENLQTLASGTWTIYCFDESTGSKTNLNGAVISSDLTLTLDSTARFHPQSFAYMDQEIVFITEVNSGANTIKVLRSQKNSAAAAHADRTIVYPLFVQPITIPIDSKAFNTVLWSVWKYRVPMRDYRVVAVEMYVANSIGNSDPTTNLYAATLDNGLRMLAGLNVQFSVDGILGIQSDVVPPYFLPQASSFGQVHCEVRTAPMGASIVVKLQRTDSGITSTVAAMTITTGNTVSDYISGLDVDPVPLTTQLSVDITSVGTTYPGERLVIYWEL